MILMRRVGALAFMAVFGMAASVLAQQSGSGMMMKDHQTGGMQQQGMPSTDMTKQDKQMGGMQDCKMMEGKGVTKQDQEAGGGMQQGCKMMEGMSMMKQEMKDQQQLMQEMKTHMKMMDEMMEMMMQRRQGMGMTPSGGGLEQQEHHPGKSQ